jgi:hypothetical protein
MIYKHSVRISQEMHCVSATTTNRLMLFRELIALYCENDMKYILWAECGVNVLKVGGTYSNHWALKG